MLVEETSGQHVIHVCRNDEGADDIHVYHDGSCERPMCPVQHWVDEWREETRREFGPGLHVVEIWHVPAHWAGATRMDADGGLRPAGGDDEHGEWFHPPTRGDWERWQPPSERTTTDA